MRGCEQQLTRACHILRRPWRLCFGQRLLQSSSLGAWPVLWCPWRLPQLKGPGARMRTATYWVLAHPAVSLASTPWPASTTIKLTWGMACPLVSLSPTTTLENLVRGRKQHLRIHGHLAHSQKLHLGLYCLLLLLLVLLLLHMYMPFHELSWASTVIRIRLYEWVVWTRPGRWQVVGL